MQVRKLAKYVSKMVNIEMGNVSIMVCQAVLKM